MRHVAADAHLDVAVERHEALPVAGVERVAAADAPGHADRPRRKRIGIEQLADAVLARTGQATGQRRGRAARPQHEERGDGEQEAGDDHRRERGAKWHQPRSASVATLAPLTRSRAAGSMANTASGRPAAAQTTAWSWRSASITTLTGVACPNGGTPPIAKPVAARASSAVARRTLGDLERGRQTNEVHAVRPRDEREHRIVAGHEDE